MVLWQWRFHELSLVPALFLYRDFMIVMLSESKKGIAVEKKHIRGRFKIGVLIGCLFALVLVQEAWGEAKQKILTAKRIEVETKKAMEVFDTLFKDACSKLKSCNFIDSQGYQACLAPQYSREKFHRESVLGFVVDDMSLNGLKKCDKIVRSADCNDFRDVPVLTVCGFRFSAGPEDLVVEVMPFPGW